MLTTLKQYWWIPVMRGVFAVIFGGMALFAPALALTALVIVFGAYALMDGVVAIYGAFRNRRTDDRWWMTLIEGVIGVIAGLAALALPVLVGLTLLTIIGFWAIFTGVVEVVTAIHLRKEIENEIYLGFAGVMSVIFGLFVIVFPLGGALAIAWLIGIYSILFGGFMIALGWRIRNLDETTHSDTSSMQSNPSLS